MTRIVFALAACCVVLSGVAFADGYKLDAKGKCHAADGKFAKAEMCKTAAPAHIYKLDDKKKCHDETGKFAKQELCKA